MGTAVGRNLDSLTESSVLHSIAFNSERCKPQTRGLLQREVGRVPLIVYAKVLVDFATRGAIVVGILPLDIPAAAPGPCIGALVVDGHFVLQRIEIGASESFNEVHITGMR